MFEKSTSYMLSVSASIYGVLAYTIAFSLEIWFIFNSDNLESENNLLSSSTSNRINNHHHHHHEQQTFIIPMTALIQASIYFVLVILSLFLVLGVIIKSIVCLLCWIIGILLAFLPESALVIYSCLNVWKIETRNGQIELCFFVFRFVMNTFFVIFVYNLIKQWKTEKMVSSYMNSRDAFSAYPHITTLRVTKNPTFLTKNSNFDTFTKYNSSFDTMSLNDLNKFKNLTAKGFYDGYPHHPYYTYFEDYDTQQNFARNSTAFPFPSEFDTSSFRSLTRHKMIRKPIDLDLNEKKMIDELKDQFHNNKKHSPIHHTNEIINSNNNTMTTEQNNLHQFSLSQSRLNNNQIGALNQNQLGFSSQLGLDQLGLNQLSLNRLNINNQMNNSNHNNIVLRQLVHKPFDYLNRPGSVMNLTIPNECDELFNNSTDESTKDTLKKNSSKSVNSLRDVAL